jgi:hypothetical protein
MSMAGKVLIALAAVVVIVAATVTVTLVLTRDDQHGDLIVKRSLTCRQAETRSECMDRFREIAALCDDPRVGAVELSLPSGEVHTSLCD